MSTWRERATAIIRRALTPPPATRAEAEKIVIEAYPWGRREAYPYKAWLLARRDVLTELYGPTREDTLRTLYGPRRSVIGGLFGEGDGD